MPLFFFLSAILQRQNEIKKERAYSNETIKRKIVSLGIPYFFFSLIYFVVKVLRCLFNPYEIRELKRKLEN